MIVFGFTIGPKKIPVFPEIMLACRKVAWLNIFYRLSSFHNYTFLHYLRYINIFEISF